MAVSPDKDADAIPTTSPDDTGMEKGEMKLLLNKSKKAPVNCAVAVSSDGRFGLLLMHVTRKPKALVQDLVKSVPGAKNARWGTAAVDFKSDPKLVTFNRKRSKSVGSIAIFPCVDSAPWILCVMCRRPPPFPV